ncbi:hypothetical protein ACJMK2_037356 [Sinanodonta woodiana]|uniref:Uncharacterized protein n=1 Tax=Sinanodonta woodiana TaxID=1069815 RepID=A0ABD3WK29_SINWO
MEVERETYNRLVIDLRVSTDDKGSRIRDLSVKEELRLAILERRKAEGKEDIRLSIDSISESSSKNELLVGWWLFPVYVRVLPPPLILTAMYSRYCAEKMAFNHKNKQTYNGIINCTKHRPEELMGYLNDVHCEYHIDIVKKNSLFLLNRKSQ